MLQHSRLTPMHNKQPVDLIHEDGLFTGRYGASLEEAFIPSP